MKKSTKILGSVALSAALAMGTAVPAFADTSSVAGDNKAGVGADTALTQGTDKSQGTGQTTVNVTTYTSQISVTVPLSVTFSLDTTGGAGYAPTNYKIKNGTVVPVKVTKAVASENGSLYGFGTAASAVSGGAAVSAGSTGDVYAKFTPKPGTTSTATSIVELVQNKANADQNLDWVIGAKPAGSTVTVTGYEYAGVTYSTSAADAVTCANAIIAGEGAGLNATKQGRITTAAASGWTALMAQVANYVADGDLTVAITEQTSGASTTDLEFQIDAASSVLKNAQPVTNNVAKIVYTVAVA